MKDDLRTGLLSALKTEESIVRVKQLVRKDLTLTVQTNADQLDLNLDLVRNIVLDV